MTALDIFVFLLLVGGAAIGFVRGLRARGDFAARLDRRDRDAQAVPRAIVDRRSTNSFRTSPAAAAVLAFAILFVPSFLIVKLLARSSAGGRGAMPVLGPVDRVLGGGFGALKGLLGATLFFLARQPRQRHGLWRRRPTGPTGWPSRAPIRCSTRAAARSSTWSRRGGTTGTPAANSEQ